MTKESQASSILKGYGLKLPKQWTGSINCWHRWHQHDVLMCWWTTYDEYISRVVEIASEKPINERAVRFMAFRPVKDERLRNFNLAPAVAEYEKAMAPAVAEYEKAIAPAWAEYEKATAPAWVEYEKAIAPELAEYQKAIDAAWIKYLKAKAPALDEEDTSLDEYLKAKDAAWVKYQKSTATAWAEYKKATALELNEYEKAKSPAWVEYQAEYQKSKDATWEPIEKGLGFSIKSIHDKECKDVPFIEESNELKFGEVC